MVCAVWLAVAVAACSEPQCPGGYEKRGMTCYKIKKDAGADAGVDGDADAGDDGDDGSVEQLEDGTVTGDGPPDAARYSLELPQIQGAASMAPGRELWTWSVPSDTSYFEVLIDDAAPSSGGRQEEPRFSAPLELGDHTFKVRACRADQQCSDWASHFARVERFGADLPRGLRDAARTLPATALGHRVAIGCNDCADGPNGEVYNLEQAAASMERAIARGADLIELNVARRSSRSSTPYRASPAMVGPYGCEPATRITATCARLRARVIVTR